MFTLTITTDNAAFDDCLEFELGRILRGLTEKIEAGDAGSSGTVMDYNGNTVGNYTLEVSP